MASKATLDRLSARVDAIAHAFGVGAGNPPPPFARPPIIISVGEPPYTTEQLYQRHAWAEWDRRNPLPPGERFEYVVTLNFDEDV